MKRYRVARRITPFWGTVSPLLPAAAAEAADAAIMALADNAPAGVIGTGGNVATEDGDLPSAVLLLKL
jgi:hypothetical protein